MEGVDEGQAFLWVCQAELDTSQRLVMGRRSGAGGVGDRENQSPSPRGEMRGTQGAREIV